MAARVAQPAGRRDSRAGKLEAGRLVFEACYRGDEARFASRGRGSVSLRSLAAAAGAGLSATTLWRLARAHVAAASLAPEVAGRLSLSQLAALAAVEAGAAREAAARGLLEGVRGGSRPRPGVVVVPVEAGQQAHWLARASTVLGRLELIVGALDAGSLAALAPRLERLAVAAASATVPL